MRMPNSPIIACDTSTEAQELCKQMAELNQVNVEVNGYCSSRDLQACSDAPRTLIISDCEGYETELFTPETCTALRTHDLLIECHDFIDIETTRILMDRLTGTHSLTLYQSIDDILKAYEYDYPELANYCLAERKILLAENRPAIMRWIFAQAK